MAEGGSGDDVNRHPLRRDDSVPRPNFNRHLSEEDVGNQARVLCEDFLYTRLHEVSERQQRGEQVRPEEAVAAPRAATIRYDDIHREGTPAGPQINAQKEVASYLRAIGDQLDKDTHLQQLMSSIAPADATKQTFLNVAYQIFSDGQFNWGRVVALFYFAYRLALKALGLDQVSLLKTIIDWVVNFIVEKVAQWIIQRGGWEAIGEYFGSTTGQFTMVAALSVLTILYVLWKNQ